MNIPVREIATAIECGQIEKLTQLKGIGRRTAQKIVASLEGKMGKFALIRPEQLPEEPPADDFSRQVLEVMVKQLGHRAADAKQMIARAFENNSAIASAEELFEEVYRGQNKDWP